MPTALFGLKEGGFKQGEFSVYLLLGYPNQDLKRLKNEIDLLHSQGAKVSLAELSPVPGTAFFKQYEDMLKEPLLHNNSIFNLSRDNLKNFYAMKNYTRELNKKFT